jgi:hypothetical protein
MNSGENYLCVGLTLCAVANCEYVSEASIDDDEGFSFRVCALHDHPKTRSMLEQGMRPGAFWSPAKKPIIVPVDELTPAHFEPRPATSNNTKAGDATHLFEDVNMDPSRSVHESFDLTR